MGLSSSSSIDTSKLIAKIDTNGDGEISKDELIKQMNDKLSVIPGADLNFSQPIMDNVEEAVSGVKGSICVKVYGDSLNYM